MAIIASLGTEHGPCAEECEHPDCHQLREMAEVACPLYVESPSATTVATMTMASTG